MEIIKRIGYKEAQELLGHKSDETFNKWCSQYDIQIIMEYRKRYLTHYEFELGYNWPAITNIKRKYPQSWPEAVNAYLHRDFTFALNQESELSNTIHLTHSAEYQPQGEEGQAFYDKMMKMAAINNK